MGKVQISWGSFSVPSMSKQGLQALHGRDPDTFSPASINAGASGLLPVVRGCLEQDISHARLANHFK